MPNPEVSYAIRAFLNCNPCFGLPGPLLPLAAQTTFATLTGLVTDGAGAVVPGATVEARHVASNYTYPT